MYLLESHYLCGLSVYDWFVNLGFGFKCSEKVHQSRILGEWSNMIGYTMSSSLQPSLLQWTTSSMNGKMAWLANMATRFFARGVLRRSSLLGNLKVLDNKLGLHRLPIRGFFKNVFSFCLPCNRYLIYITLSWAETLALLHKSPKWPLYTYLFLFLDNCLELWFQAVDGGDQGRRVTSVKSDSRESTNNMASPEARSCFHRP